MRASEIIREYGVGKITAQNATADVKPGEIQRQAKKLGMKIDRKGHPPLLHKEDQHPNEHPLGPETKPTMPAGTIRVKLSDVYDWYKLGMHISDLPALDKNDFGEGPPQAVISFGSEEEEHKYIKLLQKLGLEIIDVDPKGPDAPGVKADPRYNTESAVNETIRKIGPNKWRLYSKDGKKNLGTFDSLEAAKKHEREVQYFKHR